MIKKLSFFILCSLSISYAFSQKDTTKLFYAEKFESDAFVEFGSRIMQINNSAGMDIDLSINWLVEHKYYLGAAYNQLASFEKRVSDIKLFEPLLAAEVNTRVNYQTLGLRFGYILLENQKIISFSPDLTVSWLGLKLENDLDKTRLNGAYISPALKGVFNVSNYFRIGVELNYNVFIFKKYDSLNDDKAIYSTQFSSKQLNGIGGGVFIRVGQF